MQYNEIGKYMRIKRKSTGKSLNEFAVDNDIDSAILSRIENSKQDVKLKILYKIAKGFGQTPSKFLADFESFSEQSFPNEH